MKLYRKMCRPYFYIWGGQGFKDTIKVLEDWQPEEKAGELLLKYSKEFKDSFGEVKIEYCYEFEREE